MTQESGHETDDRADGTPAGPSWTAAARAGRREPRLPVRELVEGELEDVLQSLFAARQDVLESLGDGRDAERLPVAEATLHGCIASLRSVLKLLRSGQAQSLDEALLRVARAPDATLASAA